jgi:hypothetical protein
MIHCVESAFPQPYFLLQADSAIALYGNYAEDLFRIKKEGVLTARGLFGDSLVTERPVIVQEVYLEPFPLPLSRKEKPFLVFGKSFLRKLIRQDSAGMRSSLLDTIMQCNLVVNRDTFLLQKKGRILDKQFLEEVVAIGRVDFLSVETDPQDLRPEALRKAIRNSTRKLYRINLHNLKNGLISYHINIDFIKTKTSYLLYSIEDTTDLTCGDTEYSPYNDFTRM